MPAAAAGSVTRPCLSGVSGWALARKTRTKSRTTREEPGADCISAEIRWNSAVGKT